MKPLYLFITFVLAYILILTSCFLFPVDGAEYYIQKKLQELDFFEDLTELIVDGDTKDSTAGQYADWYYFLPSEYETTYTVGIFNVEYDGGLLEAEVYDSDSNSIEYRDEITREGDALFIDSSEEYVYFVRVELMNHNDFMRDYSIRVVTGEADASIDF